MMNSSQQFVPISGLSLRTPEKSKVYGRANKVWPLKEWINAGQKKSKRTFELNDGSGPKPVEVILYDSAAQHSKTFLKNNSVIAIENFNVRTKSGSGELHVVSTHDNSRNRTLIREITDPFLIRGLASSRILSIKEVAALEAKAYADIVGVITDVAELKPVILRPSNEEVMTREVKLLDSSETEVTELIILTFWRLDATNFSHIVGSIVLVRNAQVSHFMGVRLTFVGASSIEGNPQIPECADLRCWRDSTPGSAQPKTLVQNSKDPMTFKTLQKVVDEPDAAKLRYVSVTIQPKALIGESGEFSQHFYQCCFTEKCNTKVEIEPESGNFWCRSCKKSSDIYKMGMKIQATFGDGTVDFIATVFSNQLEDIFPVSVPTLYMMSTCEKAGYNSLLHEFFVGKDFKTTLKVLKEESNKFIWSVISMKPVFNSLTSGVETPVIEAGASSALAY